MTPARGVDQACGEAVEPLYYAKDGMVWKRPIYKKYPGGTSITIGFPVCKMHDAAAGQEAIVAAMLNRSNLVDGLLAALNKIAAPHDCGCRPCREQCLSQSALQITVDEMRHIAREAIALEGTTK